MHLVLLERSWWTRFHGINYFRVIFFVIGRLFTDFIKKNRFFQPFIILAFWLALSCLKTYFKRVNDTWVHTWEPIRDHIHSHLLYTFWLTTLGNHFNQSIPSHHLGPFSFLSLSHYMTNFSLAILFALPWSCLFRDLKKFSSLQVCISYITLKMIEEVIFTSCYLLWPWRWSKRWFSQVVSLMTFEDDWRRVSFFLGKLNPL
jgi:hypothetical protein